MAPRAGVLALQGDFAAHAVALRACGAEVAEVRVPRHLEGLDALVIPGGESTTLLHLLGHGGMFEAVAAFAAGGGALLGTCAGAILLAREVDPPQRSFGLLDVRIARNAWGRQRESFEASATPCPGSCLAGDGDLPMLFIRAPRIGSPGPGVQVLARLGAEPVLVRQGRIWACTGHPELTADRRVHRQFLRAAARTPLDSAGGGPEDTQATGEPSILELVPGAAGPPAADVPAPAFRPHR